ncbi:Metallo-dependent hydrolase [Rhizoclosmatium globosum]|uniref:Metallo-dependent hydrolase n=1 Tax=Rhizoclosmatium globosum TaxID=329046 RepID=A0A1Y2CLQ2_9FUNG|nr:Metallo-dependent hydrolase [Rhizoclosmatium globosum]|eukprot:ORY47275.1 Metallo-dependent hydrolase [Rhizoclosmatium globosum]
MSAKPSEWPAVDQAGTDEAIKDRVVQAFGLHPWFLHQLTDPDAALAELRNYLLKHPSALVGEIGLDGVATHPNTTTKYEFDQQLNYFTKQWNLAAELRRPVSVHAVGCYGKLEAFFQDSLRDVPKDLSRKQRDRLKKDFDYVEEDPTLHPSLKKWPPAIMLHSYSGSTESIRNILRYPSTISTRFYFSFSHFVNSRTPFDRMKEKICAVPDDRILIESDLNDARVVDGACMLALDLVAKAKGWSLEDAAIRTGANALRFLSRVGV